MTRDEAFQQYEKELAKIDKEAFEARRRVRATLNERLTALRVKHHEELKAIRTIQQKVRN